MAIPDSSVAKPGVNYSFQGSVRNLAFFSDYMGIYRDLNGFQGNILGGGIFKE